MAFGLQSIPRIVKANHASFLFCGFLLFPSSCAPDSSPADPPSVFPFQCGRREKFVMI